MQWVLKQSHIFVSSLPYNSATMCQIDPYKVSKLKFKSDLCNSVKIEMIELTAPPQQPQKWGTIFWDNLYVTASSMVHFEILPLVSA